MLRIRIHWFWIRIRIQHFSCISIRIRIQAFLTKNWKKITAEKIWWNIFLIHKGRPSYRKSLQPSKENIQLVKTWIFDIFILFLWLIFDPDPDFESGSTDLIESGSNPDPDLQHCFEINSNYILFSACCAGTRAGKTCRWRAAPTRGVSRASPSRPVAGFSSLSAPTDGSERWR